MKQSRTSGFKSHLNQYQNITNFKTKDRNNSEKRVSKSFVNKTKTTNDIKLRSPPLDLFRKR